MLTPRQQQIEALVRQGHCDKDIARLSGLSVGTVKVYLHNIYEKLGVHSRLELALLPRGEETMNEITELVPSPELLQLRERLHLLRAEADRLSIAEHEMTIRECLAEHQRRVRA